MPASPLIPRALLAAAAALALASTAAAQQPDDPKLARRIAAILAQSPVIDGHNDLPFALRAAVDGDLAKVDLRQSTANLPEPLHTDIPRLRAGGVGAQFWSVYVPAALQGAQSAEAVHAQIDIVRRLVRHYPDALELATSAADVARIQRAGRIASLMGMEGGEAINSNLAILRGFRAAGVAYMTLCHSLTTAWVDSATDAPRHGGLSPFGEEVVREMNRIGMLVDLSHVSAEAMRDALRVAKAPVIFSHSSAFAVTAHPRNVPDDVLAALPANGGLVMVNFYPVFVSEAVRQWAAARTGEEARQKALHPGEPTAAAQALTAWATANPRPASSVADVADHIDHIAQVAGHDHVGFGGDYDGVPFLPNGLEGVDAYPAVLAELARRGWTDDYLIKLTGANALRVLRAAEAVSAQATR